MLPNMKQDAITVLVIEDQRVFAQMLKTLLQRRFASHVLLASHLEQANRLLEQHHEQIDIAICDLHLPDGRNLEVISAVEKYDIPIIAMTGKFPEELRGELLQRKVVDYVLKESFTSFDYVLGLVQRLCRNKSIKALIVDDSASSRMLLHAHLNQQCIQAELAVDGVQGLAILEKNPEISLILVDHEMPKMNGMQFTAEVRKRHSKEQLAIIGISASANDKLSARFLKHGANDFLSKPFSYEELLCRVSQNLDMLDLIQRNRLAAISDYLTGLYNRRYFFGYSAQLLEKREELGWIFLAMIDIDFFKKINDQYGHLIGDQALIQTAKHLRELFPDDFISRLGGEEFVILFQNKSSASVAAALETFRQRQQASALALGDGLHLTVPVSIGCAMLRADHTLDQLLDEADKLLYQAKENGRNQLIMPAFTQAA